MSKEIPLSCGKVAIVDDADFEELNQWKWCLNNGYAVRSVHRSGTCIRFLMHRQILNAPKGMDVDHADHNPLNNQRSNIRLATRTQNRINSRPGVFNKTGGVGVMLREYKRSRKFEATIRYLGKIRFIGAFETLAEASAARAKAATAYYGEFAPTTQS